MARGRRRLGAFLTPDAAGEREARLVEAVALLADVPSPRGAERTLAEAVVAYAGERWPAVRWRVQEVDGPACAQVVGEAGDPDRAGVLLYSHLDTSLTGEPGFDVPVTGSTPPVPGAVVDRAARTVRGFGLGVAKAPAAASLVAFGDTAMRLSGGPAPFAARLLLAARGTHRAPVDVAGTPAGDAGPTGVERYLADATSPAAAIVAKGGPAGVLHDEPGAAYVQVVFRAGWGAVMSQQAVNPSGGLLVRAGTLIEAVQAAGTEVADALRTAAPADGQAGACFGIGAMRGGQPGKADLVPGLVEVFGYLVGPGALDGSGLARALERSVRDRLAAVGLAGVEVEPVVHVIHDGATTPADAAVVRAAVDAWRAEAAANGVLADPVPVSQWTGSTDGVVLRGHAIPTVRLGPSRTRAEAGADVVDLDELLAFTGVYERLLGDLALG